MAGASEALVWQKTDANLERHNHPKVPAGMTHFGYQGFPDGNFFHAKKPVLAPPSADVTDVSHFFRKDSSTQRFAPEHQAPPSPMRQQQQEPPSWLQSGAPPSPQHQQQSLEPPKQIPPTISPRYEYQPEERRSDSPRIRDPQGQMTEDERRKKMDEARIARDNYDEDLRRKEMMKEQKREEQKKFYDAPSERGDDVYQGYYGGGDYDQGQPLQYDGGRSPRERPESHDYARDRKEGMLDDQERDIQRIQRELAQLKEQRGQESYREPPPFAGNPRAHSEPLTDRPYRGPGRAEEDYLGVTPRRRPVGDMFQTNTTYSNDFDTPFNRHGRKNLGNPNREGPFQSYWPFQRSGAGAPLVNRTGQRHTQIQGAMGRIGRECSDSADAKRRRGTEMLEVLKRQKEDDKIKKMMEKEKAKQGYVEMAAELRSMKVGYPRYLQNGQIAQHHLSHAMSRQPWSDPPSFDKMKRYKEFLDEQTAQKQKDTRLAQLEEHQQARKHQQTIDAKFGPEIAGGGNRKGQDLRKVNLERAIHMPQNTSRYYQKVRMGDDDDGVMGRFNPRITVNSTHKNLYEFPEGSPKSIDAVNYMGQY